MAANGIANNWDIGGVRFRVLLIALASTACSSSKPAAVAPRWLAPCATDADCAGSGACLCGRCTVACQDACVEPAGTVCTRTSSCGSSAAGVCVSRCVQASDCTGGLGCQEGFCTAPSQSDAGTVAPGQSSLPGTLAQGSAASQGVWARSFPGVTMTAPEVVRGPNGEILVHVTSERLPHVYSPLLTDDWLLRLDGGTGELLWMEKVNPGLSMAIDATGHIVLAWPPLLQKLDENGDLLWSIPRAAQNVYEMVRVAVDGAGNIVLARTELDDDPWRVGGDPKGLLLLEKLDKDGELLWSHALGDGTSHVFGAFAAVDVADNVVFWSPWVESAVDFGGGPLTGKNVLAKYDASGRYLWSKVLGGFASNSFPNPTPVVVDATGTILIPNGVSVPVDIGLGEIWCTPQMVVKLDATGAPQWNKCMPVEYLSVLPDGGFVTSVRVFKTVKVGAESCVPVDEDDGAIALYDKDGNAQRSYCMAQGGYQVYGAIIPDNAGTFILAGAGSGGLTLPGGLSLPSVDANVWTAFIAKIAPWN